MNILGTAKCRFLTGRFTHPGTPKYYIGANNNLRNFPVNLLGLFRAHTKLPPKQISVMFTQPHSFLKLYPNTFPSTHSSYQQYQSPKTTPSTCHNPTPSHRWAIPGHPGWPHRSHCTRIQGWIPLPGPIPDAVVYPVLLRG